MGKLDGKVAYITGAARGQGRSHAVRLAREGADIIAVDVCAPIESVPYPMSTPDDLTRTVEQVEELGRGIVARQADVRDEAALRTAFEAGLFQFGRVDIVLANAGVAPMSAPDSEQAWQDVIDVNLTGVLHTVEVALPAMIDGGRGGAIVVTGSTSALNGAVGHNRSGLAYTASKHGVLGLTRSYANRLAPHQIRVNSVHPTGVNTPMIDNEAMREFFEQLPAQSMVNALPVHVIEADDVSNAILWLVSDEGRYITGVALPVDAGVVNK